MNLGAVSTLSWMPSALALNAILSANKLQRRFCINLQNSFGRRHPFDKCSATLRDTHFLQTLLTVLHTVDSGLIRGTRSSPCPPASASSLARSASHASSRFWSSRPALCMEEPMPHLSLRAPHRCAKRLQLVSRVFNVAATGVLLGQVVVPTVASSARLLQSQASRSTAFLESLLASVPPQLPVLLEAGRVPLLQV